MSGPVVGDLLIRLSTRAPVVIVQDDWPVFAKAEGGGVLVRYQLWARSHKDGRIVVYGVSEASKLRPSEQAAGYLLPVLDDDRELTLYEVFVKVAQDLGCGYAHQLAIMAMADLPPEVLE